MTDWSRVWTIDRLITINHNLITIDTSPYPNLILILGIFLYQNCTLASWIARLACNRASSVRPVQEETDAVSHQMTVPASSQVLGLKGLFDTKTQRTQSAEANCSAFVVPVSRKTYQIGGQEDIRRVNEC